MKTGTHNRRAKALADRILLPHADVREGKMFGYPAYFVGKRLIACHYGNAIGIRVRQPLAEVLLESGRARPFQPHGKPKMREWIQITVRDDEALRTDVDIFQAAIDYARCRSGGP